MNQIEKTVPEAVSTGAPPQEVTRESERFAVPAVDIYEEDQGLVVLADLPGVAKEGLVVQVEQGILTIEGRVDRDTAGELLVREFVPASFFRQFRITEAVDPNRIRATLRNGVLRLDLPTAESAKPRRIPLES